MKSSKKYSINWRNILHGFLVAFGSATFMGLIDMVSSGTVPDFEHIKVHVLAGLGAGLSYLFKKFFQNSEGKFNSEPKNTLE